MSPELWAFLGLVVTNTFALLGVALQNRRQNSSVQDLHAKVNPVSNGFAGSVQAALSRIESRLDEHMKGHP